MVGKTGISLSNQSTPSSSSSRFERSVSVSKAAGIILKYLKNNGIYMITGDQIKQLSKNELGKYSAELVDSAKFLSRHPEIYKLIETHDVAKPDGLAGYLNFEWASKGAFDISPEASIAKIQDTFDLAIEKSSKITEMSTEKKVLIDSSKQRPNN